MMNSYKCWMASVIGWILTPCILGLMGGLVFRGLSAISHVSFGGQSIALLYTIGTALYTAICVAIEFLLIRAAIHQRKSYGVSIFFAILLQLLVPVSFILLATMVVGGTAKDTLFGLILYAAFFIKIILYEYAVLFFIAVSIFLLRRTRFAHYISLFLLAGSTASIIVLGIIEPSIGLLKYRQSFNSTSSKASEYDVSSVQFRQDEKAQTTLGKLPRPLEIYRTGNTFFGLGPDNQRVELPFMDGIAPDTGGDVFFDVYTDRVFYEQGGKIFLFDINTKQQTQLPDAISDVLHEESCDHGICNTRHIIDVHKDDIALGFYGDTAVVNMTTGERINTSTYFDGLYFFWVNGQGYRLFLDTHSATYDHTTKNDETLGNILWIYMDNEGEPYHIFTQEDMGFDRWGSVIYGGGERSYFFKDKTPILTLKTDFPNDRYFDDNRSRFSVRELYLLDNETVGLVIESKLIVIDLRTLIAQTVTNDKDIQDRINQASLLSSPPGLFSHAHCVGNTETDKIRLDKTNEELFCLQ